MKLEYFIECAKHRFVASYPGSCERAWCPLLVYVSTALDRVFFDTTNLWLNF